MKQGIKKVRELQSNIKNIQMMYTNNSVTIKANQAPYNYVTRTQAISLAEGFKNSTRI